MLVDKIRGSKLYQEKLSHTKTVALLKRGKKGATRMKNQMRVWLGLQERYPLLLPMLERNLYTSDEAPSLSQIQKELAQEAPVDVIVPIYNGYDYLVRLFQDLPKAGMPCRFILVDDKSPDVMVHVIEQEFVQQHKNAVLIEQETNQGFVCSVNAGLAKAVGHVALVNTDTELPEGWLARLMYPIIKGDKVGTTTPYTNSGTIFSFPNFCYNNPIYRGLSVDVLDAFFRQSKCKNLEAPTGVGFCMGMNRAAIDAVGVLDAEKFGRGYGEENDWCQRAAKAGFHNVSVENLFVYHKHGGSFLSDEKAALIEDHMKTLRRLHPDYEPQVSEFVRKDGNKELRQCLEMVIDTHVTKSVLYFNHSLGGGATSYLNQQKERLVKEGACVTTCFFDPQIQSYTMFFENERGVLKFENTSMDELRALGRYLKFDEIIINQLVLFPYLEQMQNCIVDMVQMQKDCKLIMLCHDLFAICPSINLVDESMVYCGMPCKEQCDTCFAQKRFPKDFDCKDRETWNARWAKFLSACDEVRCFSKDTMERMQAVYGEELKYTLVPHKVEYAFPIEKSTKTTKTLNIGILGVLTVHKGGILVSQILTEIEKKNLPVKIKLIGRCEKLSLKDHPAFSQTGSYTVDELPKLIYDNDIDLFFISSVWPETFSYTADEVMHMGLPCVCLDIGAPAERIGAYERGHVICAPEGENVTKLSAETILSEIMSFADKEKLVSQFTNKKKILYLAEYLSFSSRYRLEHLAEEMLYMGIPGDFMETQKLPKNIDWDAYSAVVIYRCRYQDKLPGFIADAKEHGVKLYYDIDDYIFEYDAIKDLDFLKDPEYKDFEAYTGKIKECMAHMDAFIVSTNHMEIAVKQSFPEKPVFVNRNVASARMLILSALAKNSQSKAGRDRFVLGYYSGSKTHNADFELIAQELLEFMKAYPNVYLKVVGCLELPKAFAGVEDRIIREGFMDWTKLPGSIAEIDLNLMPLEDSFFHACKSENKWMEAALVGVPTIASSNAEMEAVTKPMENIVLCKTKEDWKNGLVKLYKDKAFCNMIAENAYACAVKEKTTLGKKEELYRFLMGE